MAEVVLSSLSKVFPGGVRALDDLDLTIEAGEFFALLGPSGCGKTTLLRTIAGLEQPTAGSISIGGADVTGVAPGERNVAMVFQDYALYPHMTVVDNIAYPLKIRKVPKNERRATAAEAGTSLQLDPLLERRPRQLSGGQQQRVAVARAIAYRPRLFLFDEPLSNLDARLRLEARTFLKRLQQDLRVTTVYVTHDQSEALALADRMAVMEAGKIRQLGTPLEVYQQPASLFVASFIGSTPMNLLEGVVEGESLRMGGFHLPLPEQVVRHVSSEEEVVLGLRPEYLNLRLSEEPEALSGTAAVVELLGTEYLVTVESQDVSFKAISRQAPQVGDRVWAVPEMGRALLYRADDGGLVGSARVEAGREERERRAVPAAGG
ncbi:MAG: ABC transporter ATP-binding protein [Actinomycetota bacterium]|nr:ABC transporter ATP-binding protein [Actinomycetota bacterium]